jgi:hypothetical protein
MKRTSPKISKTKYSVPDCVKGKCSQTRYSRWLGRKARAHVSRDRKRRGNDSCTVARYKAEIHAAVAAGGDRDHYTGEVLNWSLISTFENHAAKAGGLKYKKSLALLPTVDHTFDEHGRQRFVICSWRVNDAKSDLTADEFYNLCELVLRHQQQRQTTRGYKKVTQHA